MHDKEMEHRMWECQEVVGSEFEWAPGCSDVDCEDFDEDEVFQQAVLPNPTAVLSPPIASWAPSSSWEPPDKQQQPELSLADLPWLALPPPPIPASVRPPQLTWADMSEDEVDVWFDSVLPPVLEAAKDDEEKLVVGYDTEMKDEGQLVVHDEMQKHDGEEFVEDKAKVQPTQKKQQRRPGKKARAQHTRRSAGVLARERAYMGHEDEFAKMIRDHERMRAKVEIWKKLVKDADSSQLALLQPTVWFESGELAWRFDNL